MPWSLKGIHILYDCDFLLNFFNGFLIFIVCLAIKTHWTSHFDDIPCTPNVSEQTQTKLLCIWYMYIRKIALRLLLFSPKLPSDSIHLFNSYHCIFFSQRGIKNQNKQLRHSYHSQSEARYPACQQLFLSRESQILKKYSGLLYPFVYANVVCKLSYFKCHILTFSHLNKVCILYIFPRRKAIKIIQSGASP